MNMMSAPSAILPSTAQPMVHPGRKKPRFRPFKALRHFRNLIKDKEDTSQVFHIFEALPRRHFRAEAERFVLSAEGQKIRAAEPHLPDLLDDHATLRACPAGSVAHAYCGFMEREQLSAAGLVAEHDRFTGGHRFHDLLEWYANRNRDTHDMLHILTGYGRDALGEACVLAFTYGQNPAPANLFIAYMAGLNIKKQTRTKAPVFKAINEARKIGRACPRISEQSVTDLLSEPLDSARSRRHIPRPRFYEEAHRVFRSEERDPYDLLASPA